MTQEEKAKRYDELLLKLQKAKVDDNVCDEMYYRVIDDIVPELAKSEDERIREELIAFLKENHETGMAEKTWSLSGLERWIAWLSKKGEQKSTLSGEDKRMWKLIKKYAHYNISDMALETDHITREQLESWLEKQGEQILANSTKTCKDEQKHVDKVEPKFKVGYWVTCKEIDTALIVNITDDKYEVEFIDGNKGFPHIDYVDRLFSFWTIQNAKDGDVLYSPTHHLIWIYKDNEHYYACINMNYVTENVAIDGLISIPNDVRPATKEQREQLEKAMTDAGYTFDKKELKKIEHKPAWSEEDERNLQGIIDEIEANKNQAPDSDLVTYDRFLSWLKSLQPQSTWKPSDEQIKAVKLARSFVTDDFGENPTLSDVLVELEKQLKKLTE